MIKFGAFMPYITHLDDEAEQILIEWVANNLKQITRAKSARDIDIRGKAINDYYWTLQSNPIINEDILKDHPFAKLRRDFNDQMHILSGETVELTDDQFQDVLNQAVSEAYALEEEGRLEEEAPQAESPVMQSVNFKQPFSQQLSKQKSYGNVLDLLPVNVATAVLKDVQDKYSQAFGTLEPGEARAILKEVVQEILKHELEKIDKGFASTYTLNDDEFDSILDQAQKDTPGISEDEEQGYHFGGP